MAMMIIRPLFVARHIHCGHNWLCKNKLSVLGNSKTPCFIQNAIRMVNIFHLWNWTRGKFEQYKQIQTQNLKTHFGDALSCRVTCQNLADCLKKYLLQVLVIWNWILSVANSSNVSPGKHFVQYKLILN